MPTSVVNFAKFCLVGCTGVVVDMLLLYVFASPRWLALTPLLSKPMAAEGAVINNFVWNEMWTFTRLSSNDAALDRFKRFVVFNLVCLTGIAFSSIIVMCLTIMLRVNLYIANALAIVTVSLWNFVMSSRYGWKI